MPTTKTGSGVFLHLESPGPNRNVDILMGERNADPKLRQAITRELAAQAKKGASFRTGGKAGRQNKTTATLHAHISALITKHPRLTSAAQLFKKADPRIVGTMAERTFASHVAAVKKK